MSNMVTISFPEQLVRTLRFTLGVPDQFTVALDGTVALFLRSHAGDDPVTCLWALDLDSGTERLLADPAELVAGLKPDSRIGVYAEAGGVAAFIDVLDAERTLQQNALSLADAATSVSIDLVVLYKALGGGWGAK